MKRRYLVIGTVLLVLAAGGGSSAGPVDLPGAASSALVEEVAGLNRSLDRLTTLLENLLDNQRVDLLLKRITLKERRISPMESRLRGLRNELADAADYLREMEAREEEMERTMQAELRRGGDIDEAQTERMEAEMEMMLKMERQRMEGIENRIRTAEDELAEGRKEIAILDEMLMELLTDRDR